MNQVFLLLFTAVNLLSCKTGTSTNQETCNNLDNSISRKPAVNHPSETKKSQQIEKQQLLGLWTDGSSENATFDIQQDSIYYTNEGQAFPYYLQGDSLTIRYPDMSFEVKVYFLKDTLVLSDPEFGTTKYYRFKD